MTLSIITINYNNAEGLRKTLASVALQTYAEIEHIIIDGGSTDESVEILEAYPQPLPKRRGEITEGKFPTQNPAHKVIWVSEKDNGIYNAMNKGIEIALDRRVVTDDHTSLSIANSQSPITKTDYIQILNSGDILAAHDVTERMMAALQDKIKQQHQQHNINNPSVVAQHTTTATENNTSSPHRLTSDSDNASSPYQNHPAIFYGNMTKVNAAGQVVGKSGYTEYSLRQFYSSTLNHDCAYIRADLFEQYGLYDENLKIVSDWKWYLQAIGLGRGKPEYVDIDVTIFDDGGISETNLSLRNKERRQVLEELLPPAVLWDYDTHAFEMEQMNRLRRWKLYPIVYFMERVLFKLEKWGVLKSAKTF